MLVVDRLKREEERIAREMAEKEEEEARAVLEQAARSGKIKLPSAEGKLDKETIQNLVTTLLRKLSRVAYCLPSPFMVQFTQMHRQ